MRKSKDDKSAAMVYCIGEKALEMYNNLHNAYADPSSKTQVEDSAGYKMHGEPKRIPVFE